MGQAAKTYIYGVIGAGGLLLAWSLAGWSPVALGWLTIFAALAVLASMVKLKLPGMDGTYSMNFLFMLYGVAHSRRSTPPTWRSALASVSSSRGYGSSPEWSATLSPQ